MNDRDIVKAARRAQEAAAKRETHSDIAQANTDISRLAEVLSQMLDLHDDMEARLTRLEQLAFRVGYSRRQLQ